MQISAKLTWLVLGCVARGLCCVARASVEELALHVGDEATGGTDLLLRKARRRSRVVRRGVAGRRVAAGCAAQGERRARGGRRPRGTWHGLLCAQGQVAGAIPASSMPCSGSADVHAGGLFDEDVSIMATGSICMKAMLLVKVSGVLKAVPLERGTSARRIPRHRLLERTQRLDDAECAQLSVVGRSAWAHQ